MKRNCGTFAAADFSPNPRNPLGLLGIACLILLNSCTVQLNNPQSASQGMLAPQGTTPDAADPDEEDFMPADHVRIRPSTDRTRINDSLNFSAEGGTPPYLFLIEEGTGTLDNLSGAFTAPGTPGYAIVGASDELGTSDRATVIFKDPPVLTPTPSTLAVGNVLRIGAAGGSRPYIYSITTGTDKTTYDSNAGTLTALAPGTSTLTLTDLDGETASMSINIVSALSVAPVSQVLGFNETLTLTTTGGVSPINYRIAAGGGSLSGTSDSSATFTAPATTGASVIEARDSLGNTAIALIETTPPLLLSPNRSLLPLGQVRDLVASGGSPPYSFAITSGGGSLLTSNALVSYTAPAIPGTATLTVTDSKGLTASADLVIHATLSFEIEAADVTAGETIQLTATGGVGTLSYSVLSGSGSVDGTGLYTATNTPGTARVRVTDSATNSAEATLHILAPLSLSPATLSLTSGTTSTFGTTGGLPPYSYSVVSGGSGTGTILADTGAFTAGTTPGSLQVQVTDSRGSNDTSTITVLAPLAFTLESQTVLPESTTPITTTGGLAAIGVSIFAGPGTLSGGNFIAPAGNGTTILKAQDSLGNLAYSTITTLIPLSIIPATVEIPGNASLTFSTEGGVPPYRYSLGEGSLGNIAPSSGLFLAPPGSGNAQVVVTDSTGTTATAAIGVLPDVRITSPASGTVAPTGVTLGGTCEIGLAVAIGGSGTTSTQSISCADGTYSTFVAFTSGDGPKTITASQTSGALTRTVERIFERLSPLPSGISITLAAGATHINSTTVAVTLTATDAADVYLTEVAGCGSGGNWQSFGTNKSFSFSARNTTVTVYAKFRNSDLNEGACISDSIIHDDIAPLIALSSPADGALSQGSINATGTCEAGLSIAVSGTGVGSPTSFSCGSDGTFNDSFGLSAGDGSKSVTFSQTDAAGNATLVAQTYTKDATAPATPTLSPTGGTVVGASETLSGNCESGTSLLISGTGLSGGPHTLSCTTGNYSQLLTFTAGSGGKAFSVTSTDSAGNSATATSSWTRDATSPTLTVTSHTNGAAVQGTPILSGACESGASTVSITGTGLASSPETTSCSSGAWSKSATLSAGEGAKALSVSQSDSFSNTSTVSLNLVKDTTAPSLTFSPDPNGTTTQGTVSVAGICETGIAIVISGSGATSPASLPCPTGSFSGSVSLATGDGSRSVTYSQTDAAGNSTPITHSYVRDTAAPIDPTVTPADGSTVGSTATLSGSCETGTTLTVSGSGLTGGPHTVNCPAGTWSTSVSFTNGEGSKPVSVTSTDSATNSSSTSVNYLRDMTGPTLTLSTPSSGTTVSSSATLSGACEDGGSSITISGTGLLSSPLSASCNIGAWSIGVTLSAGEGAKTLGISQNDPYGNSTSLSLNLTSDRTAPTSPSLSIDGADPINSISVSLTLGASETPADMYITQASDCTSGGSWEAFAASKAWTLANSNASNTVRAKFRDAAGNETGCTSDTVTHDSIAPAVALTSPAAGTIDPNGLTVSGTCDTGTSVVLSGGVTSQVTTSCTAGTFSAAILFSTGAGAKTIVATQTDAAGNAGSASRSFTRSASSRIYSSSSLVPADGAAEVLIFAVPTDASGNYLSGANVEITASPTTNITVSSGHATPACTASTVYCKKGLEVGDGIYMVRAKVAAAGEGTTYTFTASLTGTPAGTVTGNTQVLFRSASFTQITANTVIDNSATYLNKHLWIKGGTVTFATSSIGQTYGHIFVNGTATVKSPTLGTSPGTTIPIDLNVSSFTLQSATSFTLDDGGYYNGRSYGSTGPSTNLIVPTNGVATSYGGLGGSASGTASSPVYGNYRDPLHPGSGSGQATTGIGGGLLRIQSTEGCAIRQSISAERVAVGAASTGGALNFRCSSIYLDSTATLTANGSNGTSAVAGYGGGRIALVATGDAKSLAGAVAYPNTAGRMSTFTAAVQARGGTGSFSNNIGSGGAGTIYIKHSGLTHGDLLVHNGCNYQVGTLSGKTRLPSLAGLITGISGNTLTFTPSADSILNANTVDMYKHLKLRGDVSLNNGTPSDWSDDFILEVSSNNASSITATTAPNAGVAVGDTLRSIDLLDHLEVSGCALLQTAGDLFVTSGSISNPDQPQLSLNNSGISLLGSASTSFTTASSFSAGTWTFSPSASWPTLSITGGTIIAQGLITTTGGLTVSGGTITNTGNLSSAGLFSQSGGTITTDALNGSQGASLSGGTLTTKAINITGNLDLSGSATVTHPVATTSNVYSLAGNISGTLTLNGTSRITADGKGYPSGYGFGASGPSANTPPHAWNGGSNGGTGGIDDSYPGTGSAAVPMVHGNYRNPVLPGTGTGSTNTGYAAGGGVIALTVGGICTINNGTSITANIESGQSMKMAAGGSIRLICGGFAGTASAGAINTNGGSGGASASSSGGGGRIALISTGDATTYQGSIPWPTDSTALANLTSTVQARGGISADSIGSSGHGGAGSIFLQHSYNLATPQTTGGVLIYENGRTGTFQIPQRSGVSSLRSLAGTITAISGDRTTLTVRINQGPANHTLFTTQLAGILEGVRIRPDISNDTNSNGLITDDEVVTITNNTSFSVTSGVASTIVSVSPAVSSNVAVNDVLRSIDVLDGFYVGGGTVFQSAGDLIINDKIVGASNSTQWNLSSAFTQFLGSAISNITPSYSITAGSYHLGLYQMSGDLNATSFTWNSAGTLSSPNLNILAGGGLTHSSGTIDISGILNAQGNLNISSTLTAPTITTAGNYSQTAATVTTRTMSVAGNLSLSGTAKLTHAYTSASAPSGLLDASVGGNLTLSNTSQIDAIGRGYLGGTTYGFSTSLISIVGSATSHGGMGGYDNADTPPSQITPTYDDYRDPALPGSGDSRSSGSTTSGGGVIRIAASGACSINDSATIDASSGFYQDGQRAAGGSIKLSCASFGGTATGVVLKANSGYRANEPGGGGGRIALISSGDQTSFSGPFAWPGSATNDSTALNAFVGRIQARGAGADSTDGAGGAGTLFLKHSGLTEGVLIISNGNSAPNQTVRWGTSRLVSLAGTVSAISADRLTLTITGTTPYTLSAQYNDLFKGMRIRPNIAYDDGTPANWSDDEVRTVVSNTSTTLTLNAPAHASVSAGSTFRSIDILDHIAVIGGGVLEGYGDIYVKNGPLSNTGSSSWSLTDGLLNLGGSAAINLTPSLNLTSGNWYAAGTQPLITFNHSTSAAVTFNNISVTSGYTQSNGTVTLNGTSTITGGVSVSGGTFNAANLTVNTGNYSQTGSSIASIENLTVSTGDVQLSNTSSLSHPASSSTVTRRLAINLPAGNLTLSDTSKINANEKGWPGGTSLFNDATFLGTTNYGACHGGTGGKFGANAFCLPYDNVTAPNYPGSGTNGATSQYGGGVVKVTASGVCTINNGTGITANGYSPAGSGGSIFMNCAGFAGNAGAAAITVRGGNATLASNAGGGGGRIALISSGNATSFTGSFAYPSGSAALSSFKGVVKATGGNGFSTTTGEGGAGTIYLKHSGLGYGDLIIDNEKTSAHATYGGSTPFLSASDNTNKIYSRVDTNTVNVTSASTPYSTRLNYFTGTWIHIDPVAGYTADPLDGAGHTFIPLTGNGANTFITGTGLFPAISASNYAYRFVTRFNHLDIAGYSKVNFGSGDLILDSGCDLHSSSGSAFDIPTGSSITGGTTFASSYCRSAERTGTATFANTYLAP
jgi:hypothetical protein